MHGAGRVMSRTEAKGKRNRKTGEVLTQGRVSHDEMQTWLRGKGVHLVGGDLDEAPQAYRRLPDVLAHHDGTVRIEHTLRPVHGRDGGRRRVRSVQGLIPVSCPGCDAARDAARLTRARKAAFSRIV